MNNDKRKKQYAVIGLGRFGFAVARTLFQDGEEVLAIDKSEEAISSAEGMVTHAAVADVGDERTLRAVGIENFDVVIIAIGSDLEASVMCVLACKELGVKHIVAKAQNVKHKAVLEKVGVDEVVIPEQEMGIKLATRLTNPLLHDVMAISSDYSIIDMELPMNWQGKSLMTLDIRRKFGINVIGVERGGEIFVNFGADIPFEAKDKILVIGRKEKIDELQKKAQRK